MTDQPQASSAFSAWILAIRVPTLTAAVVPVVVGTAVAARSGMAHWLAALAALVGGLLIQIGTNLVNDVDDYERGADTAERQGPTRVIQAGLLSPREVRLAAWLAFAAAALVGMYLCVRGGWPIMLVGIAAILSGLAYTGGPWPLGYNGLGDVFVFIFFGLVAVVATFYVQAGTVTDAALAAAIPVGALATAILVVNNVRDCDTDRAAGKHTLAVRLGQSAGRLEYVALVLLAYAVPAVLWARGAAVWILLPWVTVPWAFGLARLMVTCQEGARFNRALRSTARLHAAFGALFAVGLLA
ncbi:MAG: 1,4-dihydroxy-2-naphthoate octaprenyltransferase [Deltaproteobacteria bacterium]|nr:1,4-dihydroxy-2-naphthoate octaprenyltransferase [Deltaproteobacteria bacterium]